MKPLMPRIFWFRVQERGRVSLGCDRAMDERNRGAGRRKSARTPSLFSTKLTFPRFAGVLLFLTFLALSPMIFFHTHLNQAKDKGCNWISPLVCAHGGDTSRAPPNTFPAYKLALDAGVDCIEMDVSRTKDGVLVTLHDRELSNMANSSGLHVGDFTFEKIQEFDAGFSFPEEFRSQRVPSFDNALRYVSRFLKQVIVDVKVGPPLYAKNLASEVKSAVERTGCRNCVVWSKVDQVVYSYGRLSDDTVGYIVMDDKTNDEMINPLRITFASVVGMFHELVNNEVVSTIHRVGKKVYAWTVNDKQDMMKMLQAGVDCVITSQPRLLKEVMNELRADCAQTENFVVR